MSNTDSASLVVNVVICVIGSIFGYPGRCGVVFMVFHKRYVILPNWQRYNVTLDIARINQEAVIRLGSDFPK